MVKLTASFEPNLIQLAVGGINHTEETAGMLASGYRRVNGRRIDQTDLLMAATKPSDDLMVSRAIRWQIRRIRVRGE